MKESNEIKIEDTIDQGRSQYYECELPTGIIVDKELHKSVLIREMTGYEEDLLGTIRAKNTDKILQQLIERCVVQIGDIKQGDPNFRTYLKNLVSSDRMYLIIHIRIASLGAEYSFRVQCPECEKSSNQTVDLRDFRITGLADPMKRGWEGVLPSGKTYKARVTTTDVDVAGLDPQTDALSYAIMQRLVEIEGKKPIVADVKGLSMRDRSAIRQEIKLHEGEIDNSVEMVCPSCSAEFASEISMTNLSFFFPSVI